MFKSTVMVSATEGIHLRIAAEIVHKSDILKDKYDINLYIKKVTDPSPITISIIALISLKILQNDMIEISCLEDTVAGKRAVLELCEFINEIMENKNTNMNTIDNLIEQTKIAHEQILESISLGIVVVDTNSSVVYLNNYGYNLIGKGTSEVIGKNVLEVIPTSDLPDILDKKRMQIGNIQHINGKVVIVNRSPIFSGDTLIGAVGVFQDISELVGMKELNEKFQKILSTSGDLICFVDENRKITYINPAYEENLPKSSHKILGKDLINVSPNGLRLKVFNSKEKLDNYLHQKEGLDMLSTVEPLFIDNVFKGIISVSRPVNQIKDLLKKLEKSQEELAYYKEELQRHAPLAGSFSDIIGSSGSLREALFMADRSSKSISTVLIRGESGTGKELIAKAIHNNSDRKDKPFVRVNCAAIPENLLESELFGYEKGAFTGAVRSKPGKFSIANGGTIFLDEIGDMPKAMQAKLLRVLQEKEFETVGGIDTQKVDTRVIAATNRNLEEMIESGEFREDLYYRLNVMTIVLPPLRHRKEDITLLVDHFIKKINKKIDRDIDAIDEDALHFLQDYNWPGNIRELENVIERAVNMCDGKIITYLDLPMYITSIKPKNPGLINLIDGELLPMEEYEKEIITIAMKKYKSYNKVGKVLGLTHRTVALKCQKYGINN
ncbi:sigma 54-interacting transcriptional regulator [Clostridium sp. 19966]|uniref:sigma 54-interacting transcriptional regulator n=1 Tax=Clostridium sp. 19966 TaxID=2768166 RepID=UPI0028DEB91F|nr:sigma 54-interacting transcriptional regulator [Clostridium sp. 19966]MDT8715688.1 sigma 54-interacting transcriptional regulator [Clostridium sp. 19966]